MNITAFGLPTAAYFNHAYACSMTRGEAWIWAVLDIVVQMKFLPCSHSCMKVAGAAVTARNALDPRAAFWLMSFGLLHAIFFWDSDILLNYGLIGLLCLRLIRQALSECNVIATGTVLYLLGVISLNSRFLWYCTASEVFTWYSFRSLPSLSFR